MSSQAEQIIARNAALRGKASNFFTEYQDCADYIMPRRGQIITQWSAGESQTIQLFDRTAGKSNLIFAAGLLSHLTPPGELWARFEAEDKDAGDEEKAWWDKATQQAFEEIHRSNFYLAQHETNLDYGCFCTGGKLVEQGDAEDLLNFNHLPAGSYVIAENNKGKVDTVFREWKWTARQAEQEWGRTALGTLLTKAVQSNDPKEADKEFTFIHAIYPRNRDEVREGLVEGSLRPIASCYVCVEDKKLLKEDGYYEMPASVSRLMRSNGEVYGRGPGLDALPMIKLVNRKVYDQTLGLEKAVNPGWLMPEDSAFRADNRPSGTTYWDTTNPNNKPEQLETKARLDWLTESIREDRELIREEFFVDMFQMLNRPEVLKGDKTAFQIAEMLQEKLILFAPFFARITQEDINVTLARVFAIMAREGRFDTPPQSMIEKGGARYRIVYTSKIALAIKAAQDNAIVDMLQLCALMQPFDQSVSMVINWRDAFKTAARNRGVSAKLIRSDEDIDAMVAQMQQAQAAMQEAELAEKASKTAQNLGPKAQEVATNAVAQFQK